MSSSSAKPSSSLAVPVRVREMSAEEAARAKQSASPLNFDAIEVLPPSSPGSIVAELHVDQEEAKIPRTFAEWKTFFFKVDGEDAITTLLIGIVVFVMCSVAFISGFAYEKTRPVNYAVIYATITGAPIALAIVSCLLMYMTFKVKKYRRMRHRVGTGLPRTVVYTPRRQPDPTPLPPTVTPTSVDTGKTGGTTPSGMTLSVMTASGTIPSGTTPGGTTPSGTTSATKV